MKRRARSVLSAALAAAMLSGLMLLPGCSQTPSEPSDSGTSAPTGQTGGQATQQAFVGGWPYTTPPTGHYNMFVSNAIELKFYRELHQLPLATYVAENDSYEPMLAESWEVSEDGTTFTVNLRQDVTWRTGEAFTAKDVWTTFLIYRLMNNPVWDYIDSVNVASDYVVEFEVKTPTTLLLRYVLRKPMVDYLTYGTYAEQVQALLDAGKDEESEEWKSLANDFSIFRPEIVNATGPYYLDPANVSESCVILKKNESSFLADTVNFSEVYVYNGDVADLTPLVLNGEVDFLTHQFSAATMETFENMGYEMLQVAGVDGIALYFNEAVEPLDKVEVRQAMAYVIDRERVGELALPGVSRGTEYITGMGDTMTESWVDVSKLENYDTNTAKAGELLESAGLTQQSDGQWYLESGEQFTLELQCPTAWSDASTAASEIAQQLTAFGIKTTVNGIDSTMRQNNINSGDYEIALSFFGTGQPHPMFAYETPLLISNVNAPAGLGYSMVQDTEACGQVDLSELITASTAGWDEEAQREAVEKIALTVNETLPYLPIYTKWSKYITSNGMRTDWGTDKSLYQNSAGDDNFEVIKILNGELKPLA